MFEIELEMDSDLRRKVPAIKIDGTPFAIHRLVDGNPRHYTATHIKMAFRLPCSWANAVKCSNDIQDWYRELPYQIRRAIGAASPDAERIRQLIHGTEWHEKLRQAAGVRIAT